jgi:hypothetical protein
VRIPKLDNLFYGDIDASPDSKVLIFLSPVNDDIENYYELELSKAPNVLNSFLQSLHAKAEIDNPITMYGEFIDKVLDKHFGHFYTSDSNINEIIEKYRSQFTPESEFPTDKPDAFNVTITESIKLKSDVIINKELIKCGKRIKFYHKGRIK